MWKHVVDSGKNTKHFRNRKLYKSWNTCLACQSKSLCEFVWDFIRVFSFNTFYYFLKTLWKMMVRKMKKRNKVNIFMRYVCHSPATFLASYSHQNQKTNKFRTGWSVTYKKKVEVVNRSVTKEVVFQNLANCKLWSCNFT